MGVPAGQQPSEYDVWAFSSIQVRTLHPQYKTHLFRCSWTLIFTVEIIIMVNELEVFHSVLLFGKKINKVDQDCLVISKLVLYFVIYNSLCI